MLVDFEFMSCASAKMANAPREIIVGALLHDIGWKLAQKVIYQSVSNNVVFVFLQANTFFLLVCRIQAVIFPRARRLLFVCLFMLSLFLYFFVSVFLFLCFFVSSFSFSFLGVCVYVCVCVSVSLSVFLSDES